MSDITLTDITIHIDQDMDTHTRQRLESGLRLIDGVIKVHMPVTKKHLIIVEYTPGTTSSTHILAMVREFAGQAEMIGL